MQDELHDHQNRIDMNQADFFREFSLRAPHESRFAEFLPKSRATERLFWPEKATMKIVAPLLALSTLALGFVCLLQWDRLNDQQTRVAALQAEVESKSKELFDMNTARKQIEQQLRQLTNAAATPK